MIVSVSFVAMDTECSSVFINISYHITVKSAVLVQTKNNQCSWSISRFVTKGKQKLDKSSKLREKCTMLKQMAWGSM